MLSILTEENENPRQGENIIWATWALDIETRPTEPACVRNADR
jgi:hypothetical protein